MCSSTYQFSRREPKSLVKPVDQNNPKLQNEYNQKVEEKKSRATRHIFLIRHGQYNLSGETDAERTLTELGMYTYAINKHYIGCIKNAVVISSYLNQIK